MSFSVGIVGLPNVGKSTLFKALTKQKVDISNYPFCTIDPNVGVVQVPDQRLEKIAQIIKPKKITPTVIEFVDIAGLVRNAHKGEGLGNQFLARIREVAAILHVVRAFEDEKISHLEGRPDPQRDMEIINTELMMKDLETVNKRLEKIKKQSKSGDKKALEELAALEGIKKMLEEGKMLWLAQGQSPETPLGTVLEQLLTAKPMIYVLNIGQEPAATKADTLSLNLQLESEMSELTEEEQKELELPLSKLPQLIQACYKILDLITFYTITGGQETRAWTLKKGSMAPQAGGVVHTDFEEKFIRAEVINWQKLIEAGTWSAARDKGWLKIVGRDYVLEDGDVVEFKI